MSFRDADKLIHGRHKSTCGGKLGHRIKLIRTVPASGFDDGIEALRPR
jgi:hypothetical protein